MDASTGPDLTVEDLNENIGRTDDPALIVITVGGEFESTAGEYLSPMVVGATRT